MEFYDQNNRPPRIPTPTGSPWRIKRKAGVDEKGNWCVKEIGKTNVYEKIQAAKDSTEIYNIIERYENGEIGLIQRQGTYGDVSEMPKSIFEAETQAQEANQNLNKLPKELRQILIEKGNISESDIKAYVDSLTQKSENKEQTE